MVAGTAGDHAINHLLGCSRRNKHPPLPDRYFQVTRAWTPSSLMPNSMLILTATVTWLQTRRQPAKTAASLSPKIARYNNESALF